MKKLLALVLLLAFTGAAKAQNPPSGWDRYGTAPFQYGDSGVPATLILGTDAVDAAQAEMAMSDTYDVLSAGFFGYFTADDTFLSEDPLGMHDNGTAAMLVIRASVDPADYYGNYSVNFVIVNGQWWGGWVYFDSADSTEYTRHCTGGDPTFQNWMNVVQVDTMPDLNMVDAVAWCGSTGGFAKYHAASNTLYVYTTLDALGGTSAISMVDYRAAQIPMSSNYRWWRAAGKTNWEGTYFGWLATDDPPNPTSYTGP